MLRDWHRACSLLIALSGALMAACRPEIPLSAGLHTPTPRPILSLTAPVTPRAVPVESTATPLVLTPTPELTGLHTYQLQGVFYDAAVDADVRLLDARLSWQFAATELQAFNGEMTADDSGMYQVALHMRPDDEVSLTAVAPGYQPSTVWLRGTEINTETVRLNFGLYHTARMAPTVPGDLGIVEVRGIVYNATRGPNAGIAAARISVAHATVVRPAVQLDVTTSPSGTFTIPLELHASDQLDFTIGADGFITTTVSRRASEVIDQPQLQIALQPAP